MEGKWGRVYGLTASCDRDGFPRRLTGENGSVQMTLSGVHDLERYWREVRHCFKLPAKAWMIHRPKVEMVADNVALVQLRLNTPKLSLRRFALLVVLATVPVVVVGAWLPLDDETFMSLLAILPSLFVMALVPVLALFFLWRNKHAMAKIVVNDGRQWRIFSGEWRAQEDRDQRWLKPE